MTSWRPAYRVSVCKAHPDCFQSVYQNYKRSLGDSSSIPRTVLTSTRTRRSACFSVINSPACTRDMDESRRIIVGEQLLSPEWSDFCGPLKVHSTLTQTLNLFWGNLGCHGAKMRKRGSAIIPNDESGVTVMWGCEMGRSSQTLT